MNEIGYNNCWYMNNRGVRNVNQVKGGGDFTLGKIEVRKISLFRKKGRGYKVYGADPYQEMLEVS